MKTRNASRAGHLYKPRPNGTLKKAMADLVEAVGGTLRAADLTGISKSQIQRCTDDAEPDSELKLSHVRILERFSGSPIVTAFMALDNRCALLPLEFDASSPLSSDMARLGERVSKLFSRYADAMTDGKLTAREAGEMREELLQVFGAGAAMISDLDARMAEGGLR